MAAENRRGSLSNWRKSTAVGDSECYGNRSSLASTRIEGRSSTHMEERGTSISPYSRRGSSTIGNEAGPRNTAIEQDAAAALRLQPFLVRMRRRIFGCCEMLLQNAAFTALMTMLTVFVLVGDDIRLICFQASADRTFDWITGACLVLFSIEMLLSCLVKEDYFPGFWFLADLFASASLIFDLTFVSESIIGSPEITSDGIGSAQATGGFEESEYARASRSSRVGSRIARILRVLRLARLSRVLKHFYKAAGPCAVALGLAAPVAPGEAADVIEGFERHSESRVGKKLSERTPQRVILIVLALLFVLPQLDPGDSVDMMGTSAQYGADIIYQAWQDLELDVAASASLVVNASQSANTTLQANIVQSRWDWEVKTLFYVYSHRFDTVAQWLYRLAWVGYVRNSDAGSEGDSLDIITEAYWQMLGTPAADTMLENPDLLDGEGIASMVGSIPEDVMESLHSPWSLDCSEAQAQLWGVTLDPGVPCPRKTLRQKETTWYMPILRNRGFFEEHLEGQFIFIFDVTRKIKWEAAMGILQTVLVVIVLAIGALLFSRDVDNLVLHPIERMISKVELIRLDPLYAIRLAGPEPASGQRAGMLELRPRSKKAKRRQRLEKDRDRKNTTLETKMLENTIIKLGSLLALGFGEAGVSMIAENLDNEDSQGIANIPGSKVDAIFGFCDIRHFHIATEVLKEQTMVFVNQVAEIVHRVVDLHLGAPNKNLGQAFLLVWQLSHFEMELRPKIADLSVMAFIKIVSELSRDRELARLCEHPLLQSRMPDFRVSVGFGLHLGWAIAGAIGSEFKIDASYLSPHVNLASQLEEATQEYGVTMLMSEPLVRSCNPAFSRHFRPVDHVQLAGSKKATQLFTVDLDTSTLRLDVFSKRVGSGARSVASAGAWGKFDLMREDYEVHQQLVLDKHVRRMRAPFVVGFFQEFERGFLNYLAGEWDVAAPVLAKARTMLETIGGGDDGPSKALFEYMQGHEFEAPVSWPGWRVLCLK
mmetsp:Transcript_60154/g.152527  ORF Transcript_60154/g.152527 Transcript_60154/m.152527 type:complete len:994 (-) Transcript_60154:131-3112(-)